MEEAAKLRKGATSVLGSSAVTVDNEYYLSRKFNLSTVATRAFVLQLAQHNPRSFLSGSLIELDTVMSEPNRSEFHHCYPRAYLSAGVEPSADRISDLVNYAFLTRAENREISDSAPSEYRTRMPADSGAIFESQLLPEEMFDDDWQKFREQRAAILAADAAALVA